MAQPMMTLNADEMPAITRALLGIAFVVLLLSVCQLVAKGLLYVEYLQAGVHASVDLAPVIHLGLLACLFVGLGRYVQRRADAA